MSTLEEAVVGAAIGAVDAPPGSLCLPKPALVSAPREESELKRFEKSLLARWLLITAAEGEKRVKT